MSIIFCHFSFLQRHVASNTLLLFLTILYFTYSPSTAIAQTRTTTYTFTEDNQTLNVDNNSGIDHINVSGSSPAVSTEGKQNWLININTNSDKGIVSDAGNAIHLSSTSGTLNLTAGKIQSNTNSINLYNLAFLTKPSNAIQTFNISKNASILSQNEKAIYYFNVATYGGGQLTINNNGLIESKNKEGISISTHNDVLLVNNGVIKGKNNAIVISRAVIGAYYTTTTNPAQLINNGLIEGSIETTYNTTLTNSATIKGNIDSELYKLVLINNKSTGDYESRIDGNISLGSFSESSVTLNGGAINGMINFGKADQQINLNGGSYTGEIYGSQDRHGIINVNGDFILNADSTFGIMRNTIINTVERKRLDRINITNGAHLSAYGSAYTQNLTIDSQAKLSLHTNNMMGENTSVKGTLDFGDSNRTFTGNVAGSGSGTFDIGSGAHQVNGRLHVKSGDTIAVTLSQVGAVGSITSSDIATVESGAKLAVGLGGSYQYLKDGSQYKIVSGAQGSTINAITDNNINANASGTNKAFRVLTFSSRAMNNDLYLHVSRATAQDLTNNRNHQEIYTMINNIGNNATGELKSFQEYIDHTTSTAQFESALQSVAPQNDDGTQYNNITTVNNSMRTTERRLDAIRIAEVRSNNHTQRHHATMTSKSNKHYKLSTANKETHHYKFRGKHKSKPRYHIIKGKRSGISSGDSHINKGIWGQTFGSIAKQNSASQDGGFNSKSNGVAFGYDQKISPHSRLGIALSYANSRVKSTDTLKRTDVNTYQANIYHGTNFGKYFLDSMIGFAWNEYNSRRSIAAIGKTANAQYYGQSYISRIRTGFITDIGSGWNVIPQISLNYVHNRNDSYSETGAGTLNLDVQDSSTHFLEGRVGVKLGYFATTKDGGQIIPELRTSYGYDFIGDRQTITSNFSGQTATFTSIAAKIDPRSFRVGMGIEFIDVNDITLSADYNYERKSDFFSHSGSLRARYDF